MSVLLVWSECAHCAPSDPASMTRTAAEVEFPDLGSSEEQMKFVLPRIADPTEELKAVPNTALLTLARSGLGHRGGDGPSIIG